MNGLIESNQKGELVTSSVIISKVFSKVHRDLMRDIKRLECSVKFKADNFVMSYHITSRNRKIECFEIKEDGFYFLAMGFTGSKAAKWKESFILEFKRLRTGTINFDARMAELDKKVKANKAGGAEWSELGRLIKKDKKQLTLESNKLLNDVQLKLKY